MSNKNEQVKKFWDERAKLGETAGSNDFAMKHIEVQAIKEYVSDGLRILEIGCGSGGTAIELAKTRKVNITAIDYSDAMIVAAKASIKNSNDLLGVVAFEVRDILDIDDIPGEFDLVFTERTLINLESWERQKEAISKIINKVRSGGLYVMCENSIDGLEQINVFRRSCGLEAIAPPWHNRYLVEENIRLLMIDDANLIKVRSISSSYQFVSRVINAWLAKENNEEPRYDSKINELGQLLPEIGDFGQTKIWVFQKK